jgi:hypothetical protein
MPLAELSLTIDRTPPPSDVLAFLAEADRRIERFRIDNPIPGFVPSDFGSTYRFLRALRTSGMAGGNLFCEWGCGFGVVAGLAAMLGFDACGIEIEPALVRAARRLADDFCLPVQIVYGSFLPSGSEVFLEPGAGFNWLVAERPADEELAPDPEDFDVIFAYPWPGEENIIYDLFEHHAHPGALLITYHDDRGLRLQRKTTARPGKGKRRIDG